MSNKNQNKSGKAADNNGAPPDANQPTVQASHRLRYKGLDVKYQGKIISITSADLSADPDLLAFMIQKHPDELVEL